MEVFEFFSECFGNRTAKAFLISFLFSVLIVTVYYLLGEVDARLIVLLILLSMVIVWHISSIYVIKNTPVLKSAINTKQLASFEEHTSVKISFKKTNCRLFIK